MNNNTSKMVDCAIVVIGRGGTSCILNLPEDMRDVKFQSVGFDEGFYLMSSDGDRYDVDNCMSADDYEHSCSIGPFMLRSFIEGELQEDEYQVDATPRTLGMGFGA